jgi:hypothetical protein
MNGEILDGELYKDFTEAIEGHKDIVDGFFPPIDR